MLSSTERDPHVEFVARQLKLAGWIHGYHFVEHQGYQLDWSVQGARRMTLLQIALGEGEFARGLKRMSEVEPETRASIQDFWNACLAELALSGNEDSLPAFVRIVKGWRPRD